MSDFLELWHSEEDTSKDATYTKFEYLKGRYEMTGTQFENLIGFLTVILNEDIMLLAKMSPDYIVEKFAKYIGDPSKIISENRTLYGGMHAILRRDFFDKYYKVWGHADGWEFFINSPINTDDLIEDK